MGVGQAMAPEMVGEILSGDEESVPVTTAAAKVSSW